MKNDRVLRYYSENFRLKVLSEIESGRMTKKEVLQQYGIASPTLYRWIKKYRKFDLYNQRVRIETMDERDRIKDLEAENRKLKQIMADKDVKLLVSDAMLEVLRKQMGFKSVEELKKKYSESP